MSEIAEIVICGAGIAGVALAYELAVRRDRRGVVLVDERDPLSLTSDKSTEAYRNWWPGPDGAMIALMNRSIDRLEALAAESGNAFRLNRRGYLYAGAEPERAAAFRAAGELAARLGAGPLRTRGYVPHAAEALSGPPDGADLLGDPAEIRRYFPYLDERVTAALHVRRAGWFSSTELGGYLLAQARAAGARLVAGRVSAVATRGGRIAAIVLADGRRLETATFVNAAGPLIGEVARLCDVDLPVFCERHAKLAFRDTRAVVPRDAPLLIWSDPQRLAWGDDERELLAESPETRPLLGTLPAGAHLRPEGGHGSNIVLMLWAYDAHPVPPEFPVPFDPAFPEVVLRGLIPLVPGLRAYLGATPRPALDGGYYTKTAENRPLIGPLPPAGAYVLGAFSGYGLMIACGAAELLASILEGGAGPPDAAAFALERYADPAYQARLAAWGDSGQL